MTEADGKNLLLSIDIGNTAINMGLFKNGILTRKSKIRSNLPEQGILQGIRSLFRLADTNKAGIIISSVNPRGLKNVQVALKSIGQKPIVLGRQLIVPIENLYEKPLQVGQDRLVAAYACKRLYTSPALIIDFGTATTFDLLNKKGEYEGGLITPGAGIAIEALAEKTALLPKIKLGQPKRLIGKNTHDSIKSGIIYGLTSMTDGLIDKIQYGRKTPLFVLATGGLSHIMAKYSKCIDKIDDSLILKGLYLIYYDKMRSV